MGFQAHILRFEAEAVSEIRLSQHKGSALRGAFFHALRTDFCTNRPQRSCHSCEVHDTCPVCFLAATVDDDASRGADAPRPYVIEPPVDGKQVYRPGEPLVFNVVLFSRALSLFPYVVIAARRMGEMGIGASRGRFEIREVWAVEPLGGVQQRVLRRGDELIKVPNIPVEHGAVIEGARGFRGVGSGLTQVRGGGEGRGPHPSPLPEGEGIGRYGEGIGRHGEREGIAALRFKTPVRLVTDNRLAHRLSFPTLMRRLLERVSLLWNAYAGENPGLEFRSLLAAAEGVSVARDNTRWLDLERYSTRQGRKMPMGGLVGEIAFEGQLEPFLPWLIWGSITHVGKYAVMGNGWYEVTAG